ncbi:MAG: hypothetical protein A2898_02385 [Candidatus Kerfeldbacteria bacterium RIFCSPLOWO2_01_FULL_48_11]|uniref:Amidohydrolase-related domain-containing protein n=1 Tax=Candidatus Kerfeldbacteria bacterium RIFCSPLOWO2_01_FULL_48_11 TaxID=1798543 RepID=A0A1G2B1N6_9BACT|nr:MAG: 5-methylthioadenosine/S-adenosylhomocysteine deaminase [Parcubacteria group bacterium GW2011_GWA2_48_9]KKW14078.1 MAG: 5-methylthioadenosine/S-adenosylhomocysteine deaminase [Parcubacteria group bacterium GW2011_GWC2_49_9]OGY83103.1 MAG: hypothetical protein A2898_02385 [Candidatus Kerfeldbacteria bacterium RIFCSPLOWO2_01_FULL_48_11]
MSDTFAKVQLKDPYANLTAKYKGRSRYSVLKTGKPPEVILIHGCPFIISMGVRDHLDIRAKMSVLIRRGVIEDIFPASDRSKVDMNTVDVIYDAEQRGGIVITPGFVNAHAHPPMYLLRSALAFEEEHLSASLRHMALLEQQMDDDDFFLGTLGDFTEEQRWGISTVLSHYGVFDPIEKAAAATKERVINALSAVSNSHPKNTPEYVEGYIKQRKQYVSEPAIALHYLYKASPEVVKRVASLVKKHKVRLTLHAAETPDSVARCHTVHGDSEVKVLDRYGLVGPLLTISHGIYLTPEDVKIIRDKKASVVHLPTSNLLHRSGTFNYPLFEELNATDRIALGTDSIISKNRLDLLSEALQAKTLHQEMSNVGYDALFNMITWQGARLLGFKDVGRIALGFKADIAFWKLKDRGFMPFDEEDPSTLVSNMITHGGHNIRDLMIHGQFVISNRYHNLIDESALLEKLHESHKRLRERMKK